MLRYITAPIFLAFFCLAASLLVQPATADAASAAEIEREARATLEQLYSESSAAKALGQKAEGILVFPSIVKAGFMVGGQYGEGALFENGDVSGYYRTIQGSYGLQLGFQKYGYALFFMSQPALDWLEKSKGWELGVGPSIVVMDKGAATSASTTTGQAEIYAFFFSQQGLMGGLGIQGTKITRIEK